MTYSDDEEDKTNKKLVVKWPPPRRNNSEGQNWRGRGRGLGGAVRGGAGLAQRGRGARGGRSNTSANNKQNQKVASKNGYKPPSSADAIKKEKKREDDRKKASREWEQQQQLMKDGELAQLLARKINEESKKMAKKSDKREKQKDEDDSDFCDAEAELRRKEKVNKLHKKIKERERQKEIRKIKKMQEEEKRLQKIRNKRRPVKEATKVKTDVKVSPCKVNLGMPVSNKSPVKLVKKPVQVSTLYEQAEPSEDGEVSDAVGSSGYTFSDSDEFEAFKQRVDNQNKLREQKEAVAVAKRTRALNELENLHPSDAERDMVFQAVFNDGSLPPQQQQPLNYSTKESQEQGEEGDKGRKQPIYPEWDPEDEMTLQEMRDYYEGMSEKGENNNGQISSEGTVNYVNNGGQSAGEEGNEINGDGDGNAEDIGDNKSENESVRCVQTIELF